MRWIPLRSRTTNHDHGHPYHDKAPTVPIVHKILSHSSPWSHFYTRTAKTRAPELIIGKKSSHDVHKITTTNTLTMMVHQPYQLSGNPNPALTLRTTFEDPRCAKCTRFYSATECHSFKKKWCRETPGGRLATHEHFRNNRYPGT